MCWSDTAYWVKSQPWYRSLLLSFAGASFMFVYGALYELSVFLSDTKNYLLNDLFLTAGYYAIGGAIGGLTAGSISSVPSVSWLIFSVIFGHYFLNVAPAFGLRNYLAFLCLLISLVIILRVCVVLIKKYSGFDLSKNTFTAVTVVTFLSISLLILLQYVFLPVFWEKFVFNITN